MIFLSAYDLTAAPPTTEAGALKRRSGRQRGIEGTSLVCCVHSRRADQTLAAQTASDQEDCILRLEARLLAIERTLQDIQVQLKALASGMQDILAMTMAVTFLLDVCLTWTRGVALVDLLRQSVLRRDKPWDTR
jgi:hypothetical protein